MSNYTNTQRIELADKLITSVSDKLFQSEAYIDYLDKKRQNSFQILEILGEVQDIPYVDRDDTPTYPDDYQDVINTMISDRGLAPYSRIYLSTGPTMPLNEFMYQACLDFRDMLAVDSMNPVDLDSSLIFTFDSTGQGRATHSYSSFIDELKQSAYSLTCHIAALKAASSVNLSDKISVYKDKIEEYFAGVFTDISNSYAYYKAALEKSASVNDLINQISVDTNLNDLGDDTISEVSLDNANVYNYTGTTPITAMSVNCNVLSSTLKIGLVALKGVVSSVTALASKFIKTPVLNIVQSAFNPVDLNYIEDADQYTIDRFQYKTYANMDYNFHSEYDGTISFQDYDNICTNLVNKSIYLNTWFAEYIIVFHSYTQNPDSGFDHNISYTIYKKFKSITDFTLLQFCKLLSNQTSSMIVTWDSLSNGVNSLKELLPEYNVDISDEKLMIKGFVNSMVMETLIMSLLYQVIRFNTDTVGALKSFTDYIENITDVASLNQSSCFLNFNTKFVTNNANVTNADYIDISCGYYNDTFHEFSSLHNAPSTGVYTTVPLVLLFTYHKVYEYNYPLDFPFLPYSNSNRNFGTSKFSIKTDAENINAFSNIASNLFQAAIVVAVGLVAIRGINKFKLKQAQKRYKRNMEAQYKTLLGEKLSRREKKAFLRQYNSGALSSKISSGLTKSDTSELPNDILSSLHTLISLIK